MEKLDGDVDHTLTHVEMVPAVMLGDNFGMGTMIALPLSADIILPTCWKGAEHMWENVDPCSRTKLRRHVMGAAILYITAMMA